MLIMGDDRGLAQGWVTKYVREQQHLARSNKLQLEWLAVQISGDHDVCLYRNRKMLQRVGKKSNVDHVEWL